jgi:DNA invertase Pin-like site-specific DNA recombinase
MRRAIPYYRVSTERQGRSGLGLESQQKSVQDFARFNDLKLLAEYTEIESGRQNNRPVLELALRECKKEKAVLLIAKLDRLSRNVMFISTLIQSEVEFIAVDNPHADKFLVQIMAVFAEHERDQISMRTKVALKIAKERGVELGKYGKEVLSKKNKTAANGFACEMEPVILDLQQKGFRTIRQITKELNRKKVPSFRGGNFKWHLSTTHQVIARLKQVKNEL